ncbi:MAG: AAA family ATPase [Candidatus Saccharimonadales bacterium]
MQSPTIIAILGMAGSGKGTVVDYLTENYHAPKVYFGGMVYEEVEKRGLDIVRDEKMVREDMRMTEGPAVMAKRAATRARELLDGDAKFVVLDGVYSWSEDTYLRETFGEKYVSFAVVAPKNLRYQRVVARQDAHRQYTQEDIMRRDVEEIKNIEKGGPIAFADYYLMNDHNIDNLRRQTDVLMHQLGY